MRALAVLLLLVPAPAQAADTLPVGRMLLQTGWALLVVVGLILALYGIARRRLTGLRTTAGAIRVVEMRPLTPRATLALVAVRDREYLLAVGQSGATFLAQVSGEAEPEQPDFQAVLAEHKP
jgi:flagellar protein FliO/FliZ